MKNFLHFLLTALFVYSYSNVSFAQTDQKISIWDFGAEQFDAATYNNMLDDAAINAWYDSSVTGITYSVGQADSSNNKLPGNIDMGGGLSWVGNGDASDRLRTSNTNLTRYDDSVGATGVTGRVYANGNSSDGGRRYFTLSMSKGDQVTIKALSHGDPASLTFEHDAGPTVNYDFLDGSVIAAGQSPDGSLVLGGTYSHHGTSYGLNMKKDATISIQVSGSCTISFLGSAYSSLAMEGTSVSAGDLGVISTKVVNDKVDSYDFTYSGEATTLTFKAIEDPAGGQNSDVYLPSISVIPTKLMSESAALPADLTEYTFTASDNGDYKFFESGGGKLSVYQIQRKPAALVIGEDVWDFGAEQLDTALYNNLLDEAAINAWYDSSVTGITYSVGQADSSNNKLPGNIDMGGGLSWVGNGDASDRLRTSNTNLTRYDDSVGATGVTGRVYANGNSSDGGRRYFTLSMSKGDQVTIKALSHGDPASLTFEHDAGPTVNYDFLDGSVIAAGQSPDGSLVLGGTYSHHGTSYGLNMKKDATISVQVSGSCTISFLGSAYSSLAMEGTAVSAGDLGVMSTKVATDKVDTYDFTYTGEA